MKKITLSLASLSTLLLPVLAFAQAGINPIPATDAVPGEITDLTSFVGIVQGFIWIVFGLIVVIAFITAGILFLTAGGAPEKIQAARSAFIWGVVGVVVGIVAYSIVAIIAGAIQT